MKKAVLGALIALWVGVAGVATGWSQIVVGSGSDWSYLVIEAEDFGSPIIYQFFYDYDSENPLDSYDLLDAADQADALLSLTWNNYGPPEEPNYFLNSVTYDGVTLTNTGDPDYIPYWAQFVSGGINGYPTPAPIGSGYWLYGEGLSAPYRELMPGSWDGYIYNDGSSTPSIAPVPEPATYMLVALGLAGLVYIRKRRG